MAPPHQTCERTWAIDMDKKLYPTTRDAFLLAFSAWERATRYRECFVLTPGIGVKVRALDFRSQFAEYGYPHPCDDLPDGTKWCIQACWDDRKLHIAVLDDFQFDNATSLARKSALAAHEIGHMLGLKHNMDLSQKSVMHPDYGDDEPVSSSQDVPTVDVMAYEANR